MNIEISLRRAAGFVLPLVCSLVPLASTWGQPFAITQEGTNGGTYLSADVLVQFKPEASDADLADAVRRGRLGLIKQIRTAAMNRAGQPGVSHMWTALPVPQAIQALRNHPAVEFAEPNWVYQHQPAANDSYFLSYQLWGMYGDKFSPVVNPYGSQAAEAWAAGYTGSRNIVVGVIDEGIQVAHGDLAANIWSNPAEIVGNGIDDEGNGYVDDISGWDFLGNDASVYHPAQDTHGTHVAGTIGAIGGNGLGVVGVNWQVSMISGKFLGPSGGSTADAVEAVDYFTELKTSRGVNIVALNNSWGGGGYSQALHDAIIRAAKAQILFVAAAGNGDLTGRAIDTDRTPFYPACYDTTVGTSTEPSAPYDSVISVTAIDREGNKGSFANYGANTVDLGAPGVEILSTVPEGAYGNNTGTSMATPHVTGAIALYASTHPGASAAQIKQAILSAAFPTASLSGKTTTSGRLDLSTVITPSAAPSTVPSAPSGLSANVLSYSQIKLTWTDNSDNETYFEITRVSTAGTSTKMLLANLTSYIDSGLDDNTTYTYSIRAWNEKGWSQYSGQVLATTPEFIPATANFLGTDLTTQGNWVGKYGQEGYDIVHFKSAPTCGMLNSGGYGKADPWHTGTLDARDLQAPSGPSRISACYYQYGEFYFDLNLTDGNPHRVSLYCIDRDQLHREQDVTIVDANSGITLQAPRRFQSFGLGLYCTWEISGHVYIKVKWYDNIIGDWPENNAVVSGIFLDPVSSSDGQPTVSIISPSPGATVSGAVAITAAAGAANGVSEVKFFVDGNLIGTDTSADGGWSVLWTRPQLENGVSHILTAVVTDRIDQTATSAAVNVIVDDVDDPPTVSITSPVSHASVSGTVTITATASDDRAVNGVAFYYETGGGAQVLIGSGTLGGNGWSVPWMTREVNDGGYMLTAVAIDNASPTPHQSTSGGIEVTVANPVPAELHCGGLQGSWGNASRNGWKATVTVTVHDASHAVKSGATVTGAWSGGYTGTASGITDANGKVSLVTGSINNKKTSVKFTVTGITHSGYTYNSGDNHPATIDVIKP